MVDTLISGKMTAGHHRLDAWGFASGVYVCKLAINHGNTQARKLVLLRGSRGRKYTFFRGLIPYFNDTQMMRAFILGIEIV